jgi:hypothetical protein
MANKTGHQFIDVRFFNAVDARGSLLLLSACEKEVASKRTLLDQLGRVLVDKGWNIAQVNLQDTSPETLQSINPQIANLGSMFLLAHGCDAVTANELLAYLPARGYVLLAGEKDAQALVCISAQLPVLMIDAENDNGVIRKTLTDSGVEMLELPGASHYFLAQIENLGANIADWLRNQ